MDITKQAKENYVTEEEITEILEAYNAKIVEAMGNLLKEQVIKSSDKYRQITQKPFKRRIFVAVKIGNIIEMPPDIHEYMYGFDDIVIKRVNG